MNVETLIYAYLAICVSMILFNCACIFVAKRRDKALQRHSFGLKVQVLRQFERMEQGLEVDERHKEFLLCKLKKIGNLLAFDEALSKLMEQEPKNLQKYLGAIHSVFIFLTIEYRRKEKMQIAYFAYIIGKYKIVRGMPFDLIMNTMMLLLHEPSLYCRENALQAIYSSGDCECVVNALAIIDQGSSFHHAKLLTDGLLSFAGDHKQLADALWTAFDCFSIANKVAILDYLRFSTNERCEEMLALLSDENQNDEIRFACIRYLGKYHYDPAYPILLQFAENPGHQRWEYAAITATALAQYQSEHTIDVLKSNLYHSNWYIRYNAAQSLESFQLTYTDLIDVFDSNDRYAREILQYQMDRQNVKRNQGASSI